MSMDNVKLNHITDFSGKLLAPKINQGGSSHNAIYRGKNLTDVYTLDEICSMIYSGLFDDLYIGDYITRTITTPFGGTEEVDFAFADFNTYKLTGESTALTRNHAVMVPRHCFKTTAVMNETATAIGGYANSYMYNTVLPNYTTALQNVFGEHMLKHEMLLTNAVDTNSPSMAGSGLTGTASSWAWYTGYISLLSEAQVYGTTIWNSSAYDNGILRSQLALFRYNPSLMIGGLGKGGLSHNYWLCGVSKFDSFCSAANSGVAYCNEANTANGVRPYFLLG